jgi:hypothetical protein
MEVESPRSSPGKNDSVVITIPKEQVRKVSPEQVEVLGQHDERSEDFAPGFEFKNVKVKTIQGGPLLYLAPLLLPLFLIIAVVMLIPLMILGMFFGRRLMSRVGWGRAGFGSFMSQSSVFKRFR